MCTTHISDPFFDFHKIFKNAFEVYIEAEQCVHRELSTTESGLAGVYTFEKESLPSNLGNSIKVTGASVRGVAGRSERTNKKRRIERKL